MPAPVSNNGLADAMNQTMAKVKHDNQLAELNKKVETLNSNNELLAEQNRLLTEQNEKLRMQLESQTNTSDQGSKQSTGKKSKPSQE